MPHRKALLLVDANSLFRRTVAMVARELDLADVREASSFEIGRHLLETQCFDALLLDMQDSIATLALLQSLRGGALASPADLPVALTAESCDLATLALFQPLALRRIMLKPFKVKTVLEVVGGLTRA